MGAKTATQPETAGPKGKSSIGALSRLLNR